MTINIGQGALVYVVAGYYEGELVSVYRTQAAGVFATQEYSTALTWLNTSRRLWPSLCWCVAEVRSGHTINKIRELTGA